jgi:transposase-like protein
MAHLRKKERWLDHAQAIIEGKSLAKTAELCGVHPTTAFRWRHRFLRAPADDKPRTERNLEADETFILESVTARWSDLPRQTRRRGGTARHPGPYQDNIPVLVARDRRGATFDAVLTRVVPWAPEVLAKPTA